MHLYIDIALFPPTSRLQIEYLVGLNNEDYQNCMTLTWVKEFFIGPMVIEHVWSKLLNT